MYMYIHNDKIQTITIIAVESIESNKVFQCGENKIIFLTRKKNNLLIHNTYL